MKARLSPFKDQEFKQFSVIVFGNAPFFVMILCVQGVVPGPLTSPDNALHDLVMVMGVMFHQFIVAFLFPHGKVFVSPVIVYGCVDRLFSQH